MGMFEKPVRRDTAEYPFVEIDGDPTLTVKFAGESNKLYFNAVLKRMEEYQRRKRKLDAKLIEDNREHDRVLFPKFVVVGWKNVKDKDGNEVPFSQEKCEEFLRDAIDDQMFDDFRNFAKDTSNFREFANTGNTAGNSPSA